MQNTTTTTTATVCVVVALILGAVGGYYYGMSKAATAPPPNTTGGTTASGISQKQVDLDHAMRKLWEDHITYTRLYIVETAAGAAGASDTATRLMQNQTDIGNAVKAYYGNAAGDQLTTLLKAHIQGAVDILAAAKANDTAKMDQAKKDWYANADQIAEFLNKANPDHWALADLKSHMKDHLDLTLSEATNELQGKYGASIADYDRVHAQILEMSDMLTKGIVAQFPNKF